MGLFFSLFGYLNVAAGFYTSSLLYQKSSLAKRKLNLGVTKV